jgi:hypothetical protein
MTPDTSVGALSLKVTDWGIFGKSADVSDLF